MIITKRELAEDAFGEIGFANYAFDLPPGALERAVRRMDSILAEWSGQGIHIGYPLTSKPDPDDECDIPDISRRAIILNTAMEIGPGHGKSLSAKQIGEAKKSYKKLLVWAAGNPLERDTSYLPAGAGNKNTSYNRFLSKDDDKIASGKEDVLDI